MRHGDTWWRTGNTKPMADRQIDQLIGLAQGILADGIVSQAEAEMLQSWLRLNHRTDNPYVSQLLDQVEQVLADGVLDEDEGRELHDALMSWIGGGGADGEESTTASLPLDPAPRQVRIGGNIFVFTGPRHRVDLRFRLRPLPARGLRAPSGHQGADCAVTGAAVERITVEIAHNRT